MMQTDGSGYRAGNGLQAGDQGRAQGSPGGAFGRNPGEALGAPATATAGRRWEVCISKAEQTGRMGRVGVQECSHLCWSPGGEDGPPARAGGAEWGVGGEGPPAPCGTEAETPVSNLPPWLGRHDKGPQAGRL